MLLGATQIAPVAILWPIKSFYHLNKFWQAEPGGLREELTDLVLACLEAHVGVQLLDEADFQNAKLKNGTLKIGNASYSHVIVPGSTIWSKATWDLLGKYSESALKIYQYGNRPQYFETVTDIEEISGSSFEELTEAIIRNGLPKLMDIKSACSEDIRISGWTKNKKIFYLLAHLGDGKIKVEADGKIYELSGQEIGVIE